VRVNGAHGPFPTFCPMLCGVNPVPLWFIPSTPRSHSLWRLISVFHMSVKSPRATEKFVAVIAMDNKSFYLADEDGFMEGQIRSRDKINIIYRHSSPTDTVVAVGAWTRKK
jgi:hypothetical protein